MRRWQDVDMAMPETSRQALKEALSNQPLDIALADVELAVLGQVDGPASRETGHVTVGMARKGNPGLPVLGLNLAGILQDSDIDEQIGGRLEAARQVDVGPWPLVGRQ